jgi:hypothetical protein
VVKTFRTKAKTTMNAVEDIDTHCHMLRQELCDSRTSFAMRRTGSSTS